ncbi:hypothetical protein KIPB_001333 [Kipferlia bialata]|uniref:NADH:flavin oxidoreductase/NADH oxidase N-terminal domain-containing protein n=1 Tax=Kipferlia bialata TaxID=797122 RepID=A0A9K3CPY2_9EUKA|nr:hypothetical protein KIPB_001333 [Kipferlia bialata]|eukprot:g1333.t1
MFTPIKLSNCNVTSSTRMIRSGMAFGLTDPKTGAPTPEVTDRYIELAQSKCGIIMTGGLVVAQNGKDHQSQSGLHDDTVTKAHAAVLSAVKAKCPEVLVFAQITHAAHLSIDAPEDQLTLDTASHDVAKIPQIYADAARRAVESGYDGVEVHAAHGFLLSASLSPCVNKRDDEFKAGPELLYRVVCAVKAVVPEGFPIACKLNSNDWVEGGLTPELAVDAARRIAPMLALLELTGGTVDPSLDCTRGVARTGKMGRQGYYYAKETSLIRAAVGKELVLAGTGGFRTQADIESALDGDLDMVAPSRPWLRNPRWLVDMEDTGTPSACINCNACFRDHGVCAVRQKMIAMGKE